MTASNPFDTIGKNHPDLARRLAHIAGELNQAGVSTSAKRLALAAEHADEMGPEELYRFLDPGRIQSELEEVKAKRTRRLSGIRNGLALAPLLLTWLALAFASISYAGYIQAHAHDAVDPATRPFLLLWQTGFGGTTPFTFSATAALDFVLLLGVLVFTIWAQNTDAKANSSARTLSEQVDEVVAELIAASRSGVVIPRTADPKNWANVVQTTIKQAMADFTTALTHAMTASAGVATEAKSVVESVGTEAKSVVESVGAANTSLLDQQIRPLVSEFKQEVDALSQGLDGYAKSIGTIETTITRLGGAAQTLSTATQNIADQTSAQLSATTSIDTNIKQLQATQQQFVDIVRDAALEMTRAASAVDQLAVKINLDMVNNIKQATGQLSQADTALNQTAQYLAMTTKQLAQAAKMLDDASSNALRARLGLIGWIFGGSRSQPALTAQGYGQAGYMSSGPAMQQHPQAQQYYQAPPLNNQP